MPQWWHVYIYLYTYDKIALLRVIGKVGEAEVTVSIELIDRIGNDRAVGVDFNVHGRDAIVLRCAIEEMKIRRPDLLGRYHHRLDIEFTRVPLQIDVVPLLCK